MEPGPAVEQETLVDIGLFTLRMGFRLLQLVSFLE